MLEICSRHRDAKPGCEVGSAARSFGLRIAAAAERRVAIHLLAGFAGLILLSAILLAAGNLLAVGFVFERNYNEGWNVYNTARLMHHELVYDGNYWRVNNYPIVSFLVVGVVDLLFDDLLFSGRIVALASFAAIGVLAAIAIRRLGGKPIDTVFGAGCALGFCYLVAPAWIIVADPQTLGEAVMLGGFVSYVSNRRSLLRTAFIIVLGGFIKHNIMAIPVAITIDLAIRSPRRLPFWFACCAGSAAAFLGLTQIVAGGTFLDHLLSPRTFSWHGVRHHLMKYVRLFKFPLVVMVWSSRRVFSDDRVVLAAWGGASLILASAFSGFEGASYNMFQDAAVFLGIASGIALQGLRRRIAAEPDTRGRLAKIAAVAFVILLAQPIWARVPEIAVQLAHSSALLESDRRAEKVFLADAQYISEAGGPAICESLLLCHRAGQPFILDPFNSRQYVLAGKLDAGELIRRIAAHDFAVIQLRADICDDPATTACHILHYPQKVNRFTDETLYAIDRYYRIARRSRNGTFYVPKQQVFRQAEP